MTSPNLQLALFSAAVLGFRHGFDYDHIAAISDIASIQDKPRRAMQLGLLYAFGHGATVAVLGSGVILLKLSLPARIGRVTECLVGCTLVFLGIYVLGSLVKGNFIPRSRLVLLANAAKWVRWKMKVHLHNCEAPKPLGSSWNYTNKSVFGIGVIHGLGAETPSQLLIFLLAANLGGVGKGFLGLAMFLVGLLAMNAVMTGSAAGLFGISMRAPRIQYAVTALTAVYSLIVGAIFLGGSSSLLPPLG